MLASDSGTPQWLLWDLSETCTRPEGISAIFSASLVPVLPTLPVTRDHHGVLGAGARSSAEIVQGLKRVGNAEQPLLAARGREVLLDDGASGTLRERGLNEGMSVAVQTAERDKGLVGREAPAVDGDTAHRRARRQRALAAHGLHHLPNCP